MTAKASAALLVVLAALLACKKDKAEEIPPATTETPAAPEAAPEPEEAASTATVEDAAPAVEDSSVAPTPTKVTVVTRLDASVPKDAGTKDAGSTVQPATNTAADYKSIMACCNALANEAKKPGLKQNQYKTAAGVCGGIAQKVKGGSANAGAARTLIRAQLAGAPVPGSC
jgi:hypothetical protein